MPYDVWILLGGWLPPSHVLMHTYGPFRLLCGCGWFLLGLPSFLKEWLPTIEHTPVPREWGLHCLVFSVWAMSLLVGGCHGVGFWFGLLVPWVSFSPSQYPVWISWTMGNQRAFCCDLDWWQRIVHVLFCFPEWQVGCMPGRWFLRDWGFHRRYILPVSKGVSWFLSEVYWQ